MQKTLGQVAWEALGTPTKDITPHGRDEYQAMADAVAKEAVERFKASLAANSGEPYGKTASKAFYATIKWDLSSEGTDDGFESAALAVKSRVLAEMEQQKHEDSEPPYDHILEGLKTDRQSGFRQQRTNLEPITREQLAESWKREMQSGPIMLAPNVPYTNPEPSLLEVAAMIYSSKPYGDGYALAVLDAQRLIAAVREHEKGGGK